MEENKVFDWEDIIENDGEVDFTLLAEGDYEFEVQELERKWHDATEKLPACNEAVLKLKILDQDGLATYVWDHLFLCQKMEWKLSAFFRAIGAKEHGQSVRMDWDHVEGATGKCHIKIDTYNGKDSNKVDYYIDKPESTREFTKGQF